VEAQPLAAQVRRVMEALDYLGEPLPPKTRAALDRALQESDGAKLTRAVQAALDPRCLAFVQINPESRVKVAQAQASPALVEQAGVIFSSKSTIRRASPANSRSPVPTPGQCSINRTTSRTPKLMPGTSGSI
jgi:hypothetical protein